MKKIIIDVDVGTDDYLALLYLLHVEKIGKVKILGIVCTNGNTDTENVAKNVVRLLEILGRTDIPIYKGAKSQLLLPIKNQTKFHGEDGFGDLTYEKDPDLSIISNTPAAIAINSIVSKYPKEVSLICLAPLTNLALALKLYDDLASKIKDLWLMGGNYTGVGNASCAAEYNFHVDPEAAYIVLESLNCPIFILPWETCLLHEISFEWRFQTLGSSTPALSHLTKAEEKVYKNCTFTSWIPCDVYVVYCFVEPEKRIVKSSIHHASIELHGHLTRGQVVLDHLKIKNPNVTIIEDFDIDLFKQELLKLNS